MNISTNLKRIRKEKGLTQKKLGELCGMSEAMIRQYELGYRKPKTEALKKIAAALNCQVSDIDESLFIGRTMPYFANGLQELRLERGLTQKELAKGLNVSEKDIDNWENEKREPYFDIVDKIAKYFNTTLLYLYYGEEKYKKSIDITDTEAIAREYAIKTAPRFIASSNKKKTIDYPLPYKPPKFTDLGMSLEESIAHEKVLSLLDSILNDGGLSTEREKTTMQLYDILTSYNELNDIGRKTAAECIRELCYSSALTESKLDNIRFNRIQKKISNGESLTQEEIEFEHAYFEKPLKKLGIIFENYYLMLNKEGKKFAKKTINQAIEQLIFLTKIPEYQKNPPAPPQE